MALGESLGKAIGIVADNTAPFLLFGLSSMESRSFYNLIFAKAMT